jgi:hypothetical protein
MAKINIEYLKEGMILNSDVKDINGRLILGAEAVLTEKHLYIFKSWGVTEADIKGITEEEVDVLVTEEIPPPILEKAEKKLGEIFRHTDHNHTVIKELFRFCTLREARLISNEII